MVGEVGCRGLVNTLRTPIDVEGLGQPNACDRVPIKVAAIYRQREGMVGHPAIGVDATIIESATHVIVGGGVVRIAEAGGIPHVADGAAEGWVILARQPPVGVVLLCAHLGQI